MPGESAGGGRAGLADYQEVSRLSTGSAVAICGILRESPAAGQRYEILATEVEIIGVADESYPLQKKRHTFEYLRTIAHLASQD